METSFYYSAPFTLSGKLHGNVSSLHSILQAILKAACMQYCHCQVVFPFYNGGSRNSGKVGRGRGVSQIIDEKRGARK